MADGENMKHGGRQTGVSVLLCDITEHSGGIVLCWDIRLAICVEDERQEEKQGMFDKTQILSSFAKKNLHIHTGAWLLSLHLQKHPDTPSTSLP